MYFLLNDSHHDDICVVYVIIAKWRRIDGWREGFVKKRWQKWPNKYFVMVSIFHGIVRNEAEVRFLIIG